MIFNRAIIRPLRRVLGGAACMLLATAALQAPAVAKSTLTCRYVEAGPPGLAGNQLEIVGNDDVVIARRGEEIKVGVGAETGTRVERPVACVGGVPMVTNVDDIVQRSTVAGVQILFDERGGVFGPGTIEEPGSDEIEISVRVPSEARRSAKVFVLGAHGSEAIRAGDLSRGRTGVNLNANLDSDVDMEIAAPRTRTTLQLSGGEGADRVSVGGGPEFRHPLSLHGISLQGGGGPDVLIGNFRPNHINGENGNDLIRGKGGVDMIYGGVGRDRVFGEGGNDWLRGARGREDDFQFDFYSGGAGSDYISSRYGNRDEVRCGSGRDEVWVDPYDRWSRCDTVRIAEKQPSSR